MASYQPTPEVPTEYVPHNVMPAVPDGDTNYPSGSKFTSPCKYSGNGTADDPFIVDWDEKDPENPGEWSASRQWLLALQVHWT
jgi:hypothetical protein